MIHFNIKESEYYKDFRMFLTDDMCVSFSLNKLRRWFKDSCNVDITPSIAIATRNESDTLRFTVCIYLIAISIWFSWWKPEDKNENENENNNGTES